MATFFEAINDSGKTQIDDNYNTMQLIRKVKLSDLTCDSILYAPSGRGQEWVNLYGAMWYVTLESNEFIVAVAYDQPAFLHFRYVISETKRYLQIVALSSDKTSNVPSNISSHITLYTFGAGVESSDRFGLQIFNSSGSQMFHSSNKVMRVYDYVCADGDTMTTPVSYPSTTGKTLAFAPVQSFVAHYLQPFERIALTGVRFNGSSYQMAGMFMPTDMGWELYSGKMLPIRSYYMNGSNKLESIYLVLDVSNY